MSKTVLVTGASSGFGRLISVALARAGYTVYASMRDIAERNAEVAAQLINLAQREQIALRPVEMNVQSERSVAAAVAKVIGDEGKIDA